VSREAGEGDRSTARVRTIAGLVAAWWLAIGPGLIGPGLIGPGLIGLGLGVWPATVAFAQERYVGRPLADALRDLQARGLNIIFSSDLVQEDMIVGEEPRGTSLQQIVDRLLGPHGLKAEIGPRGTVLVVRRDALPIRVVLTHPEADDSVFAETEIAAEAVTEEEIERVDFYVDGELVATVRHPPWSVVVDVGAANADREFRAVAIGAWGGRGTAAVYTGRVEISDKVEVALKQLYVTVSREDRQLLDLGRGSFTVYDDGVQQELVTFERGDVPIAAVVLLDGSESMRGQALTAAVGGVRAFVGRMSALDQAMVVLFADRALAATSFADERDEILQTVLPDVAAGGTALNDHLYAALRLLDQRQGRRVVILLSDGADVLSALSMEDVLWKVRRSDALVYWIRLERGRSSFSSAWRGFEANDAEQEALERAIRESGGRVESLVSGEEIEPAFEDIMRELRSQYVLGYYPRGRRRDGQWRPVRVRVSVPSAKVRFRAGYVDQ
jgi:Ca-activated chloride channel homolog